VAASREAPRAIIDPRSFAEPEIRAVYEKYPHIGPVLPAVGYSESQLEALRRTIEASDAEVVVSATPIDLKALTSLTKSVVRARYDFQEAGEPGLGELVDAFLARVNLGGRAR
jgi:predicted GTPase